MSCIAYLIYLSVSFQGPALFASPPLSLAMVNFYVVYPLRCKQLTPYRSSKMHVLRVSAALQTRLETDVYFTLENARALYTFSALYNKTAWAQISVHLSYFTVQRFTLYMVDWRAISTLLILISLLILQEKHYCITNKVRIHHCCKLECQWTVYVLLECHLS